MAVGWSPAGSKSETILIAMPPSDFSGRAGRCGVQSCAVLVQRVAGFDQRRKRRDRGGDAGIRQRLGILQRDVEAGDRIEAGGRALLRRAAPPIEVPRAVLVGAEERSGMRLDDFGFKAPSPGSRREPPSPRWGEEVEAATSCTLFSPSGEGGPKGRMMGAFSASRTICSAQSDTDPVSGVPESSGCGDSSKPPRCNGSEASR